MQQRQCSSVHTRWEAEYLEQGHAPDKRNNPGRVDLPVPDLFTKELRRCFRRLRTG
jgi:hypothetical protein